MKTNARKKIEKDYNVDKNGMIRTPGKFEGEPWFAPLFYSYMLDGDGTWDEDIIVFDITAADIKEVPELKGFKRLRLAESEQGFVFTKLVK